MSDEAADAALPLPLVELDDDRLSSRGVRLWLKRDDLLHPALPGNKWRKLMPNVRARERPAPTLLIEVDHRIGLERRHVDELMTWRAQLGFT